MKAKQSSSRKAAGTSQVKEPEAVYAALKVAEPVAVEKIASKFGLPQETLSRMTGFSLRAVASWSSGKSPSTPVRRALVEMDRLLDTFDAMPPGTAGPTDPIAA